MTGSPTTRGFRALRHRNYRLFWSGQLVSLAGTWIQTVAQAWLILVLTNDPASGVMRHTDAGYDEAREAAGARGVRIPMEGRRGAAEEPG